MLGLVEFGGATGLHLEDIFDVLERLFKHWAGAYPVGIAKPVNLFESTDWTKADLD